MLPPENALTSFESHLEEMLGFSELTLSLQHISLALILQQISEVVVDRGKSVWMVPPDREESALQSFESGYELA